jgi:hypothetical protein
MLQLDAGIEEILRSAFAQAVPEWRSGSKPALLRARCRRLITADLNISAPLDAIIEYQLDVLGRYEAFASKRAGVRRGVKGRFAMS